MSKNKNESNDWEYKSYHNNNPNVNGLNSSIKRHRVADWIKRKNPTICCLQETPLIERDTHRLKVKGWEKIHHAHGHTKLLEYPS